jgi:thiamine phosphate synthase YjbQ (UPF0047 family)
MANKIFQRTLTIATRGRSLDPVTDAVAAVVTAASIAEGLCNLWEHRSQPHRRELIVTVSGE